MITVTTSCCTFCLEKIGIFLARIVHLIITLTGLRRSGCDKLYMDGDCREQVSFDDRLVSSVAVNQFLLTRPCSLSSKPRAHYAYFCAGNARILPQWRLTGEAVILS